MVKYPKFLFLTYIIFSISFSVKSQNLKGGLFLGIIGSQIDGLTFSGYNKLGFTAGLVVCEELDYRWGFQCELKYIMKGAAKLTTANDPSLYKLTLGYFELPLLATLKTAKKIKFESGFALGYLFNTKLNEGYGNEISTYPIKKTDISWIAGIYYLMNERISFNLKFSYSIRPISNLAGNVTIWGTYGQYNNLFDLSVYYIL